MVATVVNTGIAGGDASANASAGDDTIEAGEGNNLVAGEALATGANGGAKVDNTATATEGATATAGNDSITSGAGNDFISGDARSEEHTSELQSLMRISYAVFCLKKTQRILNNTTCTSYHNILMLIYTPGLQ